MKTLQHSHTSRQLTGRVANFSKLRKVLLFAVLISYTHLGLAQTVCIDTLNWPFVGNDTLYSSVPLGSPGYVSGHNGYVQSSTAEFISNSDTILVTGALIRFGHAETADSASIVTISIWDSSGTDYNGDAGAPGNILISKDILIIDIANDVSNAVLTEITFDSSITLTGGFYLGMQNTLLTDSSNVPGDTVAIITNTHGETVPATAWGEFPFFNGWWNFQPGWFLDVSLAIFPITSTSINASFSASADTVDLAVSGTVTFTNTSLEATSWYWWFGDGDTSTAMSPTHTYDSVGTNNVTLVASLGSCTDTIWATITVINTITGIDELMNLAAFSIFPNPTEGVINIIFNIHELQPTSIKVYDMRGSLISETTHDLMMGYCTIDLSKQAGGTYLVQFVTRDGVISQKVSVVE